MLVIVPPKGRKGRPGTTTSSPAPPPPPPPPPPVAPALVAAAIEREPQYVRLAFDRAIDIAGLVVDAITVDDGVSGTFWQGVGTPSQDGPTAVLVNVASVGPSTVDDAQLTAAGGAGIVGAGDNLPWAGVAGLGLPFP